jgi:glutamate--cysteine ligase
MSDPPVRREELAEVFRQQEKPRADFRIGAENEKFGVHRDTGAPLEYGGDFSVCQVLTSLENDHGWDPIREIPDGPVLGLRRAAANITLEPSVQFELSGEPLVDLHAVCAEKKNHLRELRPISEHLGIAWLGTGFHPTARLNELSWVPKKRYPIMREYLPKKGSGGLDMMQRTATVQGNFDWSSEADAMKKLAVALKLSPIIQAWFSNAPFSEGRAHGAFSRRGDVWRNMDPTRSGLVAPLWDKASPSYDDYVEWSLDAGMFLFWRDGKNHLNTGQTFRDFLNNGYEGHHATLDDYRLHLQTLFPEARLKNTLEVRSVDGLPPDLALASLAVWTGILYDDGALDDAAALLSPLTFESVEEARGGLIERGLHAPLLDRDGFAWANELCEMALSGLNRRAKKNDGGANESIYLAAAAEILETRKLPAERALERFEETGSLISATQISMPEG